MSGYGYASSGAGYGYYEIFLGEYNTARGALTEPGSSAYERDGDVTSYAHEGYNGGIFEQTTLAHGSVYQIATSYSYAAGYFYYGADYGSVGTSAFFNPNSYSSYSSVFGNTQEGVLDYSSSSSTHAAYGGYDHRSTTSFSLSNYADGSYDTTSRTSSGLFTYAGEAVPGSSSTYSSTSSYDASTGYMTTYHTP